jgi:predicted DNA-binding transcriptional regulator YafY
MVPLCRWIFGNRVRIGPAGPDGRVQLEVRGHEAHSLAAELAGLGSAVEVIEPHEVRNELVAIGRELVATYGRRRVRTG